MQMNSKSGSDHVSNSPIADSEVDVHHITPEQLAILGISQIAYVKAVVVNGVDGFAIHAADGTPMAVAGERELAVAAIVQHEMQPFSVH